MIKKSSFYKFLICTILTLVCLILVKSNNSFKTNLYKYLYTDNISFAKINEVYKKYLGSSIPFLNYFNKTDKVFNETLKYNDVSLYKNGVNLFVDEDYLVPAIKDGIVSFIGEKEGYGNTVIIESSDVCIWYSNLENINLSMYDYVSKGSLVGNSKGNLYLVFTKDGEFVDYKEFI